MHVLAVFTENYFRSCGCSGTNFTATINCTNAKTEIQTEIIETQITGIQLYFAIKNISPFIGKFVCLQLMDLLINFQLLRPL